MDFIDEFISNCMNDGITNISDISSIASSKIKDIDDQVLKLTSLKESYKKVILSLNLKDGSFLNKDGLLLNSILNVFEKHNDITSSFLIKAIASNSSNPELVYLSNVYEKIKILISLDIIKRNEDRTLSKGCRWDDKSLLVNIK
jgi:hypothetical protein